MSKSKFAKKVGLSEGYINRVLGGDFDGNFTNLVKISIAIGKIPIIKFKSLDKMLKEKIWVIIVKYSDYREIWESMSDSLKPDRFYIWAS